MNSGGGVMEERAVDGRGERGAMVTRVKCSGGK